MIVKLTAIMFLAALINLMLTRASAALRHLVWCLACAAALILPVAGIFAPAIAAPRFVIQATAQTSALAAPAVFNWLMAIYLAGVALMLVRLTRDILAANAVVRASIPAAVPGVQISDAATVPFVWGLRRALIVLPRALASCPEAVLAHESAHIARHDVWTTLLARLTCAVYWFHPLVWFAAAQLRLEADRACDDVVLRRGFENTNYADVLVGIARAFRPAAIAPGAVRASQLETRVRHILACHISRTAVSKAAVCVAAALCLGFIFPLAALQDQSGETVYKIGNDVIAPKVLYKVDPDYTPDAKAAHIHGVVLLSLVVGSDGRARQIQIRKSLDEGLDRNAVAALVNWRFHPAMKDGQPVAVQAMIEMNFKLK